MGGLPSKTSGALRDSAILRLPRRDAPETLSQGMVRGIIVRSLIFQEDGDRADVLPRLAAR